MLLKGRPYTEQKTDTSNLPKFREVKRSLVPPSAQDSAKYRAKLRRQFQTRPISQKVGILKTEQKPVSKGPFRVDSYSSATGLWLVSSSVQTGEIFLAESIKAGTVGIGDLVRGYHVYGEPRGWIEPKPQGRRFKPVEEEVYIPIEKEEELTFNIFIAFTGKKLG